MSTKYIFNGNQVSIPGAYSRIKSGISNPALALSYGNCLVIDKGVGAGFGGGSGINGALNSGKDSVYTFDNIRDLQDFVGGGSYYALGASLFQPAAGQRGATTLTYVRATTTTTATNSYTFTGGGANGGSISLQTATEGAAANGVEYDSTLATVTVTATALGAADDTISLTVEVSLSVLTLLQEVNR